MTSPRVPTLLVAHPGFGEGMVAAARSIVGEGPEIDLVSNEGLSPDALLSRLHEWLDAHPGPALILTDLGFGSCCQSARRATRGRDDVGIVAGVNLPVVLAVLRSEAGDDLGALLAHLASRARGSVEVYRGGSPL